MGKMKNQTKFSIAFGIILAVALLTAFSMPACAYAITWKGEYESMQDANLDTFVIKYDTNRTYNEDSAFKITWNKEQEPVGWITLLKPLKFYESDLPKEWEIVEDRSSEEPGLLVLKLPEGIGLNGAIQKFGSMEEDGIFYAKPDYLPIDINNPRYAPALLAAYPQDKLYVMYKEDTEERLPWEVIYNHDAKNDDDYAYAVVKVPEDMTLEKAIRFAHAQDYVDGTMPSYDLVLYSKEKCYVYGKVNPDNIEVHYKDDTSYRLTWDVLRQIENFAHPVYCYQLPENMTIHDAITYCGTIDDILFTVPDIWMSPLSSTAGGDAVVNSPTATQSATPVPMITLTPQKTNNPSSSVPLVSLLIGLLCVVSIELKRNS